MLNELSTIFSVTEEEHNATVRRPGPSSHDMTNAPTCAYCGYAAVILAAICLGTMGVPIKSDVVSRLDVDPLVMQVSPRFCIIIIISLSLFRPPPPPPLVSFFSSSLRPRRGAMR